MRQKYLIKYAYPKEYLEGIMNITEFLFYKFSLSVEFDYFSCVTEYMLNSDIRKEIDKGNPSALNKGIKQLINSINYSKCEKNNSKEVIIDEFVSNWLADIYVFMQWKYNIPSSELIQKLPCRMLYQLYNPLHEASIFTATDKLYNTYII